MSSRLIYLVASTGYPNYGDELIAAQWLRYLAHHEPDAEVWLDSPSPGNSQLLLGHLHPRVRFVDTVFRLCWAGPEENPVHITEFAAEAIRNQGLVPRHVLGVELLHRADVFHILGGGYVNARWPQHMAFLSIGAVLSSRFHASAAVTGLGLMPAVSPQDLYNELTATYDVIDVRDAASRALFASDHVTDTGDDALLDLGPDQYDQRESPSVMVSAQSDMDTGVDEVVETIRGTLRKWQVDPSRVGYVEAMPGSDRRPFEMLEKDFSGFRFYPFAEMWGAGLPARRGQRWITTRFHAHLLGAAAGAWGVAIGIGEDYHRVDHETLLSRGSRWAWVEAGEVPEATHGEPGFGTAADRLVEAKHEVARRIYGH